ncbi:MAG: 3-dehydroquinate synthase [Bacteroidetes bacterium]|nr:3-dehydroquinate synthase [Bacteroidota bacterium]
MSNVTFFDTIEPLSAKIKEIVQRHNAVFIICDENTEKHCLPLISGAFEKGYIISVKSGEQHKNLESCTMIWSLLTKQMADRNALIINLGGGVICDMGGFAASCYKRGIDFVHIPTTLLAMVDASVGGKTGIDFDGYKNQVGVFREAVEVLMYPVFFGTLEERQIRSGMAEVIKHYLIADADAFDEVSKKGVLLPDRPLIAKAIRIKSQFVDADPLEKNIRKALNFGHTIGHALESHYLDSATPMLHGEAVAIGMAVETIISNKLELLTSDKAQEILTVLKTNFNLKPLPQADIDAVISLTAQDKKNAGQERKLVLLTDIGSYRIDVDVDIETMRDACIWYNNGM